MFAFLALLFVLVVIYLFTASNKVNEGFDPVNTSPSHKVNIPVNVIPPAIPPPPVRNVDDSNVKPSNLPGSLPVAPYEQIAAMSPLPYQDTTLIKANRQQLVSMLELLKGFLAFEAQELSERSDPTIQLPLNTARSDFHTLQAEVDVLNRNPGLQPTITLSHLNEIAANLAFLQREVRLIGAAGPIQGPIYEFTQPVNIVGGAAEGFKDAATSGATTGGTNATASTTKGPLATPDELKEFVKKIDVELVRLSASGTTDPLIQARIVDLTSIKADVNSILEQVQSGNLFPSDIPILKSDIDKALPILGKTGEALPQIIQAAGLNPILASLIPSNLQNDPQMVRQINKLVDKYADTIVNGISASFAVNYTSPREAEKATAARDAEKALAERSTLCQTGFPSQADLDNATNDKFMPNGGEQSVTDRYAPKPQEEGRGPSQFDWKQRAKDIEGQVKKRGLNPKDFGIMEAGTKVSEDFSWRGYAKMICTRLQATMDPSLPETCGCPPMNWKGWNIGK
jgi:hypothetical protein